ncbi:DUF805 domain-containing protein [Sporolactobacillus laevolacticus]|uniref:Membrane protein n=1 Tax=Sporolactobacillus laevolacticus DSM 442 TaxID=1395513 RepID=V6IXU7_9BACL|nr:DUF805 domain-containing protein [Sporolactobacillus laevolacticus]EST12155.1 membrane protein [Sporolactobacillus laevolacticus DSM 442]
MGFLKAYAAFWKNYVYFGGRSSRSTYWWVQLWNFLIFIIILAFVIVPVIHTFTTKDYGGMGLSTVFVFVYLLYTLAIIIPGISLTVRRFHDANLSAWWYVGLCLAPKVLVFIAEGVTKSTITIDGLLALIYFAAVIARFVITLLPSKDPNNFREHTDS